MAERIRDRNAVELTPDILRRFWAKVQKTDGCWLWTRSTRSGYGTLKVAPDHQMCSHVISYRIHHGPIPDGLWVLHTCDNRRCVRPDHIYAGTPQRNAQDMTDRGRNFVVRGEQTWNHKLTEDLVREIVRRRDAGEHHLVIAADLGLHRTTVGKVITGQRWSHVTGIEYRPGTYPRGPRPRCGFPANFPQGASV